MPRIETLALVQLLSGNVADATTLLNYYPNVMVDLARENWTCDALAFAVTRGQQQVDIDTDLGIPYINLLGVIYDNTELESLPLRQLEMLDPYWRDALGRPASFTEEDVTRKTIQFYPAPDVASNPLGGTFGEPLGGDYATYNAVVFFSAPALDPAFPPVYLELIAALRIMKFEFARNSDHTDLVVSALAEKLNEVFTGMLR